LLGLAAVLVFSVARLATLLPSYQPQFTRNLCRFQLASHYTRHIDPDSAASYICL
jgi:hypothetical protein